MRRAWRVALAAIFIGGCLGPGTTAPTQETVTTQEAVAVAVDAMPFGGGVDFRLLLQEGFGAYVIDNASALGTLAYHYNWPSPAEPDFDFAHRFVLVAVAAPALDRGVTLTLGPVRFVGGVYLVSYNLTAGGTRLNQGAAISLARMDSEQPRVLLCSTASERTCPRDGTTAPPLSRFPERHLPAPAPFTALGALRVLEPLRQRFLPNGTLLLAMGNGQASNGSAAFPSWAFTWAADGRGWEFILSAQGAWNLVPVDLPLLVHLSPLPWHHLLDFGSPAFTAPLPDGRVVAWLANQTGRPEWSVATAAGKGWTLPADGSGAAEEGSAKVSFAQARPRAEAPARAWSSDAVLVGAGSAQGSGIVSFYSGSSGRFLPWKAGSFAVPTGFGPDDGRAAAWVFLFHSQALRQVRSVIVFASGEKMAEPALPSPGNRTDELADASLGSVVDSVQAAAAFPAPPSSLNLVLAPRSASTKAYWEWFRCYDDYCITDLVDAATGKLVER